VTQQTGSPFAAYQTPLPLLKQQLCIALSPLWYGGQWLKYECGEAWQVDYITLPQTCQGKCHVLTMVEATTIWLKTYRVHHATTQNTILSLEKQVLW